MEQCRNWLDSTNDRCGKPAKYIVWGKFFPKDHLGPRCEDCALDQVGYDALRPDAGYAIYNIPNKEDERIQRVGKIIRNEEDIRKQAEDEVHDNYAPKIERIMDAAKEAGIWPEIACILANGTADLAENPTYAQRINILKHERDKARKERDKARKEAIELAEVNLRG